MKRLKNTRNQRKEIVSEGYGLQNEKEEIKVFLTAEDLLIVMELINPNEFQWKYYRKIAKFCSTPYTNFK